MWGGWASRLRGVVFPRATWIIDRDECGSLLRSREALPIPVHATVKRWDPDAKDLKPHEPFITPTPPHEEFYVLGTGSLASNPPRVLGR